MPKSNIRPDRVQPTDLSELKLIYSCEDCTYFKAKTQKCVLGLNTEPHLKMTQIRKYNLSGQMLFCRFIEID